MSVLFKNMAIPGDCRDCPFNVFYHNCGETRCRASNEILAVDYMAIPFSGRPDWCPIIELSPHGDLIDREWLVDIGLHLMNIAKNDDIANGVKWLWQYVIEATAVIPAEPPKEES